MTKTSCGRPRQAFLELNIDTDTVSESEIGSLWMSKRRQAHHEVVEDTDLRALSKEKSYGSDHGIKKARHIVTCSYPSLVVYDCRSLT